MTWKMSLFRFFVCGPCNKTLLLPLADVLTKSQEFYAGEWRWPYCPYCGRPTWVREIEGQLVPELKQPVVIQLELNENLS